VNRQAMLPYRPVFTRAMAGEVNHAGVLHCDRSESLRRVLPFTGRPLRLAP